MKTITTIAMLLIFATPILAAGLVYDLNGQGSIYQVERDGDTTRVYNLGPGTPQVTIGKHLNSGDTLILSTPQYPRDDLATGLAIGQDVCEDGE